MEGWTIRKLSDFGSVMDSDVDLVALVVNLAVLERTIDGRTVRFPLYRFASYQGRYYFPTRN